MRSDDARVTFGVDGAGIMVGALSDSFDDLGGAAGDVASGDLPAGIVVLADLGGRGTDEGRGMLQLIHDVAPGADQAFHTAFGGEADFALGIEELAGCAPGSAAGCAPSPMPADVITDDVTYFAEPMFQDGIVAQAVDNVKAADVSYFSSAGNNGRDAYEAPFDPDGAGFTGTLHDFDPGPGVDTCLDVTLPFGTTFFSFQWTEPFFTVSGAPGSASDLDIGVFLDDIGCDPGSFLLGGLDFNVGGDPVEIVGVVNGGPPADVGIQISNSAGPNPDL